MKKVAVQLPAVAREAPVEERYSLELEVLGEIAEIVEVDGSSAASFLTEAKDADALITSWGINIDHEIVSGLEKCVVIGVGSVGVRLVQFLLWRYLLLLHKHPDANRADERGIPFVRLLHPGADFHAFVTRKNAFPPGEKRFLLG